MQFFFDRNRLERFNALRARESRRLRQRAEPPVRRAGGLRRRLAGVIGAGAIAFVTGAGGSIGTFECTAFTEIICGITMSLMNRGVVISGTEYPPSPYIENVGVWPDIPVDYMTKANLLQNGAPFISSFLQHMAAHIRQPILQRH